MRSCGFESHLRKLLFSLKRGKWVVSGVVVLFASALFNYLSNIHVYMTDYIYYRHIVMNYVVVWHILQNRWN